MKTPTIPGRYYIVHSKTGCTVTQETSPGKYITAIVPADEDTPVFAHAGKFDIDDEGAIVTEVFKLAPIAFGGGGKPGWYDVLRSELAELLGAGNFSLTYAWREDKFTLTLALPLEITDEQMAQVRVLLGSIPPRNLDAEMEWIDGLPIDYTHIECLENTGTQYIDTNLLFAAGRISWRTSSTSYSTGHVITGIFPYEYSGKNNVDKGKNFEAYQETDRLFSVDITGIKPNKYFTNAIPNEATVIIDTENGFVEVNGIRRSCTSFTFEETAATLTMFARKVWYLPKNCVAQKSSNGIRIHSFEVAAKANGTVQYGNFIPALDPTGAPCMFDSVTREPFYKLGTGQFIAGVETQKQLDAVLSGLPDRTGKEVGTLRVRLAEALQTPENEAKLDAMLAKNWEISQAA